MANWCGWTQTTVAVLSWVRQVVLGWVRKQAKRAKGNKLTSSTPPLLLLWFLPPGSCLAFHSWQTLACKPNEPFLPHVGFAQFLSYQRRNLTRTVQQNSDKEGLEIRLSWLEHLSRFGPQHRDKQVLKVEDYNSSSLEVKREWSGVVQSYPQVPREFMANLGHMRSCVVKLINTK